ncbi:immunoglobulin-binding protein 1b [Ostrinia furnacalis]|uniref:immunoglobulin-binding protein 1b n=1 Tax=Ostrinia furnacalis TaxID=93504 RepID=UPI00103C4DA8|nr:immunoglobulin-binding protein 1b [Ostrinia furnacalis]
MSQPTDAGQSTEEESLKNIYDQAMKLFDSIESGSEATNSDAVQMSIKSAISKFEKATNLVSLSGMFSRNENLEELPTETLQYLLLPALLGTLTLKRSGTPRKDLIQVAEVYFKDFLQRCKDYGVTDVEVPATSDSQGTVARTQSEQAKIASMVMTREAKIKRYKEMKELKDKLSTLSKAMASPSVDDDTKRTYFTTLLQNYVNQALDELSSIEQEKPILEYMEKHAGEPKPSKAPPRTPLRPVIITRDAVQKAVFGAGYPAIPSLTIEEFYDQRVRDGIFPGGTNIPHQTIQNTETDGDEEERIRKERLVEEDDPEELARQRGMDEYKDDHRRGWGNRHNRS